MTGITLFLFLCVLTALSAWRRSGAEAAVVVGGGGAALLFDHRRADVISCQWPSPPFLAVHTLAEIVACLANTKIKEKFLMNAASREKFTQDFVPTVKDVIRLMVQLAPHAFALIDDAAAAGGAAVSRSSRSELHVSALSALLDECVDSIVQLCRNQWRVVGANDMQAALEELTKEILSDPSRQRISLRLHSAQPESDAAAMDADARAPPSATAPDELLAAFSNALNNLVQAHPSKSSPLSSSSPSSSSMSFLSARQHLVYSSLIAAVTNAADGGAPPADERKSAVSEENGEEATAIHRNGLNGSLPLSFMDHALALLSSRAASTTPASN